MLLKTSCNSLTNYEVGSGFCFTVFASFCWFNPNDCYDSTNGSENTCQIKHFMVRPFHEKEYKGGPAATPINRIEL